jgi:hypothetical protein
MIGMKTIRCLGLQPLSSTPRFPEARFWIVGIWRPKIYREDFRCTIGLGALYNYSLVRTKRRARAHILSSTVKACG